MQKCCEIHPDKSPEDVAKKSHHVGGITLSVPLPTRPFKKDK